MKKMEKTVNWELVPVDTPVFVKEFPRREWLPRHFAKYEWQGFFMKVYAYEEGRTSHTSNGNMSLWQFAKLPDGKEYEKYYF